MGGQKSPHFRFGVPSKLEVFSTNLRGGLIKYYFHEVREGVYKIT
jgi:hypothetical protein